MCVMEQWLKSSGNLAFFLNVYIDQKFEFLNWVKDIQTGLKTESRSINK